MITVFIPVYIQKLFLSQKSYSKVLLKMKETNSNNIHSQIDQWADFWYYEIGVNVIPANTKEKITHQNWSQWQDKSIPMEEHESRKKNGYYKNGIAIILGRIWRGRYEGKYLVAIDLDNQKAIEEFCRDNLDRLKQRTLVEQHADTNKMHIYFIVDREIPSKASDKTNKEIISKIDTNEIPALEVKSTSKGIMFCSNSPYKNGSHYRILGTLKPNEYEAWGIQEQVSIICDKYNIPYGFNSNSNSDNYVYNDIGPSIQELFTPGTKILEGHNRNLGILRVMDSLLFKNMGILSLEQIKKLAYERNQELCVPPIDNKDFEKQWEQSLKWANKKRKEREEAQQKNNNNNNNNNTTKTKVENKQNLIEEATRLLISKHRFATIEENKEIMYYDENKGVYVKGGEILIEKELEEVFEFKLQTSNINEIKNHIMRKTYVKMEKFDSNLDIINLKNGLYNWRTNEFMLHTPDYHSLNQKPIVYNPHARPKLFIKYLKEVLYLHDIRTAVEIIAHSFIRKNLFEYYFILIGIGSNGKSVFVGVLSNLHGLKNISNVSLKSLVHDRFALVDLVNKDINVDTELSSSSINDMSMLKKLTGTQPLRVQQKGQPAFDVEIYAKQIFNANELPINSDNTDAHYRREVTLPFPRQFEGEKEDRNLLNKIIKNEEEMSGIFNLILNSLRTIGKNNQIHINASTISERRAKAKLTQNPVKTFLEDALAKEPNDKDFETGKDLYDAFYRFCQHNKLHILGYDTFSETLGKDYKHILEKDRKTIDGRRITIWKCKLVKWKNADDPTQTTLAEEGEDPEDIDKNNENNNNNNKEELEQELLPQKEEQLSEDRIKKYQREQEEMKKWD
jgi:P4 family phage/plasmid primase-like protien